MSFFQNVSDYIDEHGWLQGKGFDDDGKVCLARAMGIHSPPSNYLENTAFPCLLPIIDEHFPGRSRPEQSSVIGWRVVGFNDHPDTTEEDVKLVLKYAAEKE